MTRADQFSEVGWDKLAQSHQKPGKTPGGTALRLSHPTAQIEKLIGPGAVTRLSFPEVPKGTVPFSLRRKWGQSPQNTMPRPKHEHPTPAELEVLQVLWDRGPSTVRQVMETLNRRRRRAYTSVMSLLGVMTDKDLLRRRLDGRAYLYEARVAREKTVGQMLQDLLGRAFDGSAASLVARLLDESSPSPQELTEIRDTIEQFRQRRGGD